MQGTRVGIIGAGQLGRMMALAGYPLEIECRFVDRLESSPGGRVAEIDAAPFDDPQALRRLAEHVDVVTFDIENVPVEALRELEHVAPVRPSPAIVAVAQDRLAEKRLCNSLGIPTAPFVAVDDARDLTRVGAALGWPVVLKARRMGYDGRGQRIAHSGAELTSAWEALGRPAAIAEGWVAFERELSLLAVQGADPSPAFYPLTENRHSDGILISSLAPYEDPRLQATAEGWAAALMQRFDYRGVLAVELFHTNDGLLVNEMAPRVHNSGHWTIEGAQTSQFENHLRAILGWPLGDCSPLGFSAMVNLLGAMPERERVLALPGAHLHGYGKAPRPRRKLGHCTLVDTDRARLLERLATLENLVAESNR